MFSLAVISNIVAVSGAMLISRLVLAIPYSIFWDNMLNQAQGRRLLDRHDQAGIFGAHRRHRLRQRPQNLGRSRGRRRATTDTVVQCLVSIIIADSIFTAIFFIFKLN